jgi:hypothetical protein
MAPALTKADIDDALARHTDNEMPKIKAMLEGSILDAKRELMHAFPDGIENHREAHERMIAAARAEEAFWRDLKTDIAKKSIWGILHILFLLTIGTLAVKLGVGSVLGIGK